MRTNVGSPILSNTSLEQAIGNREWSCVSRNAPCQDRSVEFEGRLLRTIPPKVIPKGPLWRFVSGTLESSLFPVASSAKVAVRYRVGSVFLKYPLGVTNYNFGGSCEATAVDALVHANTRSIPFPFPGSSLTPLCHPTPSNLPSLFWLSLSLSRSLPRSLPHPLSFPSLSFRLA